MESFHGSSTLITTILAAGQVDVTLGGGELGRGFYTGEHLWAAKAWAYQVSGDRQNNVVQFSKPPAAVQVFVIRELDRPAAHNVRRQLKAAGTTRTHVFAVDLVKAPIVGTEKQRGDQYKWESVAAQTLLNGVTCTRTVI